MKISKFQVFDGHNDTLMDLYITRPHGEWSFFESQQHGHLDMPRAKKGIFGGGLFAIMVPPEELMPEPVVKPDGYEVPEFPSIELSQVAMRTMRAMAGLYRMEKASGGALKVVQTVSALRECLNSGILAVGIHFEGAEPIDPDLDALQVFYRAGLRSLGIVWSRTNAFGRGVPIRFPASPDTGPGLTEAGKSLVAECNRLGVLLDVSHLNYRGFMDVAELSCHPVVATHSNVHAICPCSRNLTDEQLDIIAASNGVVGINFAVGFLRRDGSLDTATPLRLIAEHIDYITQRVGTEHVALGSDFDGAQLPDELKDVTGLPKLFDCLSEMGYSDDNLQKIAHGNWLRVLEMTWSG